jgi:D-methionine transport system substrate-binding protein
MKKFMVLALAAMVGAAVFAGGGKEKAAAKTVVKIGVVGEYNVLWNPVIEALAKENVGIELVRFSEYVLPNRALEDGEMTSTPFSTTPI